MIAPEIHYPTTGFSDAFQDAGYTLIRKISSGSRADVFMCHDRQGNTRAIKIYTRALPDKFGNEMRCKEHYLINHKIPNLVPIHDVSFLDYNGKLLYYTVMDYLHGRPLSEIIAKGRYSTVFIRKVVTALYKASEGLFAADIVHRDIKPSNIIITSSDDVVLIDLDFISKYNTTLLNDSESRDLYAKLRHPHPYKYILSGSIQSQWRTMTHHCIGIVINDMIARKKKFTLSDLSLYFRWSLKVLKDTGKMYSGILSKELFAGILAAKIYRRWLQHITVYKYS